MMTMKTRIRRLWRLFVREEGYATSVIVIPGILLFVFGTLQGALFYLGSNVAQTAAFASYTNARAYQSNVAVGESAGNQIIGGMSGFLGDPHVDVQRTPTTVTVTVTGTALSLIPGVTLPEVKRTITGPVERWVPAP